MSQTLYINEELNPIEWGDLLDGIKNQRCVLCIGPQIFSNESAVSFEKKLATFLQKQSKSLNIRVYDNGWFHLLPMGNQSSPYRQVKEFYSEMKSNAESVIRQLVKIPFHLFLSFNPDDTLKKSFGDNNYVFDAYIRNLPYNELTYPTADRPLIYNMLGKLEDRNSLVLTHDDFYDYLESIFKGNSMSPILKDTILNAEYFLFVGMPFDQWYIHLFMRILRQHKEKLHTQKFAIPVPMNQSDSCREQYTIRFINSDIKIFIDSLLNKCVDEGLIRTSSNTGKDSKNIQNDTSDRFFKLLTDLLEENDLGELYEQIKKVLLGVGEAGRSILQNFIQLKGRHSDLKEQITLGLVKYEDHAILMNQLRKGYLEQINLLKSEWPKLNIKL